MCPYVPGRQKQLLALSHGEVTLSKWESLSSAWAVLFPEGANGAGLSWNLPLAPLGPPSASIPFSIGSLPLSVYRPPPQLPSDLGHLFAQRPRGEALGGSELLQGFVVGAKDQRARGRGWDGRDLSYFSALLSSLHIPGPCDAKHGP